MHQFSIQDIENLSGIKAHTLRIWEKRYGIIKPKRKPGNHRFYDNEDLKEILQISYLYHNGHKISDISKIKKNGLSNYYKNEEVNSKEKIVTVLLESTIDLNEKIFTKTLNESFDLFGFEECMLNIIYPFFERVGLLWMNSNAIPAQERFSSNIIRRKITLEIDAFKKDVQYRSIDIILFTPEGERHETPLLFVYYLMLKSGKKPLYIGNNTTIETLVQLSEKVNFSQLYFHAITNFTKLSMNDYVQELHNTFPDKKIFMSGPLTQHVEENIENVKLLKSPQQMTAFAKGAE